MVRASLAGHSLLGVVLAALIYQVCLTGTLSVFVAEFERWEQPNAPVVESVEPEAFARGTENALTRGATGKSIVLLGPTWHKPRFELRLPQANTRVLLDSNGDIRDVAQTPWTSFVVSLHDELHLPAPWGRIVIGLSGVVLLALIFTGLCAHPRIFRDAFHLRLGRGTRLGESDLHNRMSVWSLPFQIVVSATGAILALGGLLGPLLILLSYGGDLERGMQEFAGPPPAVEQMEPAPLPDIANLIRTVEAAHRPAKVSYVEISQAGTLGQIISVDTNAPHDLASGESYRFSGDGRALGLAGYTTGAAGKQMMAALAPLHYGNFGGTIILVAYGILGVMLCAVCATGVNIWLIRRSERGHNSVVWKRIWSIVVWGQPAILVLAAVASAGGIDPLKFYVVASIFSFALAAPALDPEMLRQDLVQTTALSLIAAVAANITMNGLFPTDAVAMTVNTLLLVGSLLLVSRTRIFARDGRV